jgi:dTDP-4-amino-4,6-dideoxygalactose transaminase
MKIIISHDVDHITAWEHKKGAFPKSEKAAKEVLAIPVYPELTDEQLWYVVSEIEEFVR